MAQMKPKVLNSNDIYPIVPIVLCHLHNTAIFLLWWQIRGKHSTFPDAPYEHKEKLFLKKLTNILPFGKVKN
jgi:hypothetical protein